MERCLEEISATVLDAREPLSYRTLGIRSRVSCAVSVAALEQFSSENDAVKALHVLVKRASAADDSATSHTAAAKRDPRARVLSLTAATQQQSEDLLCQQIYALYGQPEASTTATATACWAQERQARNDALRGVDKHAPLTAAAKALYASGIKCAEATARQDFGDEQGEETISAFDAIDASAKKKKPSGGSSFFKSSSKSSKSSTASRNGGSMAATASKPAEAKKLDMSNVLTVDSDDEEDDETDAPVFVKKTTSSKRVISDDDDEEEDEAPKPKAASKSRNVKRKLNASPAVAKKAKQVEEVELEEEEEEEEAEEEEPVVATKRRVLVSKTRINEQGYMVTEKTYEEVELTQEEVDKEQKAAKKQLEDKKKKAAAEKAAKAKKEAKKHSGPPKQRDLRSFFSVK
ncbi:DNA polymerase subunit Cdc27 [Phytophthora cinnamomi]|uniref:DNA polymerase subunit Cdc27 n=1 Tax=Phytophthora cinnamomi TaxID=4785 RepID=UPI00355A6B6B|nr:DNA polymerase subunit Cdc27 [Phytophthora cinnamomi]